MDIPTCVDMCQHLLTCANMWNHSRHLWYQPFGPYLHAGMSQHMWTCRDVLICTDMCRHVLIWADMCRYVPTYSITLGTSDTNHLDLTCMLACVSTFGHSDMCWYVPLCADMCRHVPKCTITLGISDTNPLDLLCMLACVSTCGHADMC